MIISVALSFAAAWRLGLAIAFCLAIVLSVCARRPARVGSRPRSCDAWSAAPWSCTRSAASPR